MILQTPFQRYIKTNAIDLSQIENRSHIRKKFSLYVYIRYVRIPREGYDIGKGSKKKTVRKKKTENKTDTYKICFCFYFKQYTQLPSANITGDKKDNKSDLYYTYALKVFCNTFLLSKAT